MIGSKISLLLVLAASLSDQVRALHLSQPPRPASVTNPTSDKVTGRRAFLNAAGVAFAGTVLSPPASNAFDVGGNIKYGDESIMVQKEHGTSSSPVQENLLYGVSNKLADKICNYNR